MSEPKAKSPDEGGAGQSSTGTTGNAEAEVTETTATPLTEPVVNAGLAKARREAANYRRRLRDTEAETDRRLREIEAERDQAREQVTALRQAELQRAFGERLADPQDVLAGVEDPDRFFTDEGALDTDAVKAEVDKALEAKPHWAKPGPGFDGGARAEAPEREISFGEAMKRKAATGSLD